MKKAPAVVLQINSPGGSPVQSRLIYERIRSLAEKKNKKVYAFAEDVAASGGYMIACAARRNICGWLLAYRIDRRCVLGLRLRPSYPQAWR